MYFEYLKTERYEDSIDIEDTGNCFLQAINDEADCWVLSINTSLGMTTAIQAGPFNIDFDEPGLNYYISKTEFEYNEKKIIKTINDFLNNPKRTITSVELVDEEIYENIIQKLVNFL